MVISLITDQFFLNPRIMPGVLRIQYLTKNTVKLNFPQRCCVFPRLNCVKSVCIWSYSGQYFPTFRLIRRDTQYLSLLSLNAGK